jgi:hypothetical protein
MLDTKLLVKKLILGLALSLTLANKSMGAEHSLVKMTNEEDKDITTFALKTDDAHGDIVGFVKIVQDQRGRLIGRTNYGMNNIEEGLTIEKRDERDIVRLVSPNFESHNGGNLVVDTLYSGVSDSRKRYEFEVARQGDSWELLRNGQVINSMHLKSNKVFLLGTVGIKDIVTK